jgi:DNA polymerase elongation subunit (family B)
MGNGGIMRGTFNIVNADTDSIAISRKDGSFISTEDRQNILDELNSLFDSQIRFEDDGYYKKVIVVKSKNYILDGDKLTIKGSALKATMKEKALQAYIKEVINLLLSDKKEQLLEHYMCYVNRICTLTDITEWCSKKTITKSVLNGTRSNETRVMDAVQDMEGLQEGDKVYVFFETYEKITEASNFKGFYSRKKLLDKLFKTIKIFGNIIDVKQFPNYALKANQKKLLEQGLLFEIE